MGFFQKLFVPSIWKITNIQEVSMLTSSTWGLQTISEKALNIVGEKRLILKATKLLKNLFFRHSHREIKQ